MTQTRPSANVQVSKCALIDESTTCSIPEAPDLSVQDVSQTKLQALVCLVGAPESRLHFFQLRPQSQPDKAFFAFADNAPPEPCRNSPQLELQYCTVIHTTPLPEMTRRPSKVPKVVASWLSFLDLVNSNAKRIRYGGHLEMGIPSDKCVAVYLLRTVFDAVSFHRVLGKGEKSRLSSAQMVT